MLNYGLNVTTTHPLRTDSETGSGAALSIRNLRQSDLGAVMALERRSFSNPWSEAAMALELAQPAKAALVASVAGRISGCAIASRHDRAWHLMKIAVVPEQRRLGIASLLMSGILNQIGPGLPVSLEVRAGNAPAIALYDRFEFIALGRRPGYYADNGEDALLMWRGDPTLAGVPAEALHSAGV